MGGSCQACEQFWEIHRDGVSKNQPIESTWSLRGPRGSKTLKAATEGFTPPTKDTALTPQEQENEKWNAKAKNHIFRGLCKEVFNRIRSHKTARALWKELCALHEGSKSEREECYHLVMNKLNTFEMLPKENANEMYSRLNVIIEA